LSNAKHKYVKMQQKYS